MGLFGPNLKPYKDNISHVLTIIFMYIFAITPILNLRSETHFWRESLVTSEIIMIRQERLSHLLYEQGWVRFSTLRNGSRNSLWKHCEGCRRASHLSSRAGLSSLQSRDWNCGYPFWSSCFKVLKVQSSLILSSSVINIPENNTLYFVYTLSYDCKCGCWIVSALSLTL